jgi:hypothetical protein
MRSTRTRFSAARFTAPVNAGVRRQTTPRHMSPEQAISLYLQLTNDIHGYWAAFGALTVLILGWLLSRKRLLRFGQRVALTIGWFAASGYLGSSLMNRYRLVAAVAKDVETLKSDGHLLKAIAELGPLYQHYETFVWTSFGAISIGALVLIWTNVAQSSRDV